MVKPEGVQEFVDGDAVLHAPTLEVHHLPTTPLADVRPTARGVPAYHHEVIISFPVRPKAYTRLVMVLFHGPSYDGLFVIVWATHYYNIVT